MACASAENRCPIEPQARLGEPRGRVGLPVLEQVVEHRVQPLLRRAPGLHQVVVEPDLVDRPDRGLGVGVGRQQHALGLRGHLQSAWARNSTPLIPGMRWSATSSATGSPRRTICSTMPEPRLAGVRQQDAVARAVPVPQVALDRAADGRIVVDRQDEGAHRRWGHFWPTLLDLSRPEEAGTHERGRRARRRVCGTDEASATAIGCACPDGTVGHVGSPVDPIGLRDVHIGNVRLTGGRSAGAQVRPDLMADILAGRLDPSAVMDLTISLAEVRAAMRP